MKVFGTGLNVFQQSVPIDDNIDLKQKVAVFEPILLKNIDRIIGVNWGTTVSLKGSNIACLGRNKEVKIGDKEFEIAESGNVESSNVIAKIMDCSNITLLGENFELIFLKNEGNIMVQQLSHGEAGLYYKINFPFKIQEICCSDEGQVGMITHEGRIVVVETQELAKIVEGKSEKLSDLYTFYKLYNDTREGGVFAGTDDFLSTKFTKICAGNSHFLALSDSSKQVYSWGKSWYGQAGHGTIYPIQKPEVIQALQGIEIKEIACGAFHSVFITDDGFLYTCGLNEYGQLGRSEFINQYKKKHNDIAKDSQVQNDGNKLTSAIRCINEQQFYSLPEPVEYFEIRDNHDKNNDMTSNTIIDTNTGLGTDSSVCSTSNRNKGLGTDQIKHSSGKYVDPVVYEASCGQFHTLISTDLGVFSCGWAKYGQLGYHPLQSDETSGNSSSIRLHLEPSNTSKNCSFIFRRIDYYNDDSQMAGSKVNGGNSGSTTDYLEVDIAKDEANINILKAKVMCGPWNSFILI